MDVKLKASSKHLREDFFALQTPQDIAKLLEIDYGRLVYDLFVFPKNQRYINFKIKKRHGSYRIISAPAKSLKIIQQKLAFVLQEVYQPKAPTHGYVRDKSIITNANLHTRKRYVLNLDLKDFFPAITFKRIRGLFMAIPYNLNENVATWLAHICCWRGRFDLSPKKLYQGECDYLT